MNVQETGLVKAIKPTEITPNETVDMAWEASDSGAQALEAQLKKIEVKDEVNLLFLTLDDSYLISVG